MSFFTDLGDGRFLASLHTTGPWDVRHQHAGPPSALLGRALERVAPRDDIVVARVTVEILGAIPVGELHVSARLVRPGRSVELAEAVLTADGREVALARAWRVRRASGVSVSAPAPPASVPPASAERELPGWVPGYVQAMEWRWVHGHLIEPGPATVWARARYPLVDDEVPTGLQRALILADSGNGASSALDPRQWWFINPELSVHLHRSPVGEWICLAAETVVSDGGCGLATSVLSDVEGAFGVGAQSLLVAPR